MSLTQHAVTEGAHPSLFQPGGAILDSASAESQENTPLDGTALPDGSAAPERMSELFAQYGNDSGGTPPELQICEPQQLLNGVDASDPGQLEQQLNQRRTDVQNQLTQGQQRVEQEVTEHRQRAEQRTEQQAGPGAPPDQCVDYPSSNPAHAPLEAHGTTFAELRTELHTTLDRELGELEQSHIAARCDLETRFQVQLDRVEHGGTAELEGLDRSQATRNEGLETFAADQGQTLQRSALREAGNAQAGQERQNERQGQQTEQEMARITAEAERQVTTNSTLVEGQIAQARSQADNEARQAAASGDRQAAAARDAANQRADAIAADPARAAEAAQLRQQGEARATQARQQTDARVHDIEVRRDQTIHQLQTMRDTENARLRSDAVNRGQALQTRASATAARLESQRGATLAGVSATEASGADAINRETGNVASAAGRQHTQMEGEIARRRTQLTQQRDRALAQLQEQHETRVRAAQARVREAERRLSASSGSRDIREAQRMVTGAMRNIDDQSVQAERNERRMVQAADREITARARRQVAELQARGRQAIATLDALARTARRRMEQERRSAERRMTRQVRDGNTQMRQIADQAMQANRTDANNAVRDLAHDGETSRAVLRHDGDAAVATGQQDMDAMEQRLEGEIQTTMRQNAVADATRMLTPDSAGNVSDADATQAMDSLNSLPADLQQQAIADIDATSFGRMLSEVPENRREEFESLYRASNDPDRKIQLWREWHVSHSNNQMQQTIDATNADLAAGRLTQAQADRRNAATRNIMTSTRAEADDVTQFLRTPGTGAWDTQADPFEQSHFDSTTQTMVAPAAGTVDRAGRLMSISDLERRSTLESEVERRYNVNLTRDVGANPGSTSAANRPTDRRFWSEDELHSIDSGLSRTPREHILGNGLLPDQRGADGVTGTSDDDVRTPGLEIHRGGIRRDFTDTNNDGVADTWTTRENVGGDHWLGVVNIFDTGVNGQYRHNGETSRLSGHQAGQGVPNGPITPLEETIVHEVGHDVEDIFLSGSDTNDISDRFRRAGGFQITGSETSSTGNNLTQAQIMAQMAAQGMTPAQITAEMARLQAGGSGYESAQGVTGDTVYENNPYQTGGYVARDRNAIPEGDGHWSYARTNPADFFAESYTTAVHTPEQYRRDTVTAPQQQAAQAQAAFDRAQAEALAHPGEARYQNALTTATAARDEANETVTQRQTQWNIMRNEVFHTDTAVSNATTTLAGTSTHSGDDAARLRRIEQFQREAEAAVTPDQVERLRTQAQADIQRL